MEDGISLTKDEILKHIPHRPPFLFLDRVEKVIKGKSAHAVKYIDPAADYLKGHFPSNPVMPGALMLESLAQTICVLFVISYPSDKKRNFYGGAVKMRFLKLVKPGCELHLFSEPISMISQGGVFKVWAKVNGEIVVRGEMSCMCVP